MLLSGLLCRLDLHEFLSNWRYLIKTRIWLFLIILSFLGCKTQGNKISNTELIEGKVSYPFFKVATYYDLNDEQILKFQTYFDSVDIGYCDAEDKQLVQSYQKLKEMNLLYNPYVYIDNSSSKKFISIFDDESMYKDVLIATREKMLKNDESIYVKLKAINLRDDLYLI